MDISLEDFHKDFLQGILSDADSRGLLRSQAFFENVCEELISSGDLTSNYTVAEYTKNNMGVYGYDYDEEREILTLLAHEFFQENEIQTLTLRDIESEFKKVKSFFTACKDRSFYQQMEETDPAYSMAFLINDYLNKNKIRRVRLILLTDGKASKKLTQLDTEKIFDLEVNFRVVDINYIYRLFLLIQSGEDFEAEVKLPCLKIPTNGKYQSYLAVVQGQDIVKLYEKFGQKLFEQNVRTFLQFRGGVNKGLRNTIQYAPDMFFAYNNGITATASAVELDDNDNIVKITNLQIVNGGQTTSAIYAAASSPNKLDVSNVAVQMKLSVVSNHDEINEFVSKVSEYANTQNKVNPSDFFSNSPFHKEFKFYSNKTRVQVKGGSQLQTHWFYERVRGEYLNDQAYYSASQKRQFLLKNPKDQLLEKTFLAKSEVAWLQKPATVSKGAQDSASFFANEICAMLEKNKLAITENYFKNAVAKVILFKFIEKLVSAASWYNQAYRSQTVAYTLSHLSYSVEKTGKFLNFGLIWEEQSIPEKLEDFLNVTAKEIYIYITHPKDGYGNPSQWCKRDQCWEDVKSLPMNAMIDDSILIDKEESTYITRTENKEKLLDNGIEIQTFVVSQNTLLWKELLDYFENGATITPKQSDILRKYSLGVIALPTEPQSKVIYELYNLAKKQGFISKYVLATEI